jgi:hypothetical protein
MDEKSNILFKLPEKAQIVVSEFIESFNLEPSFHTRTLSKPKKA